MLLRLGVTETGPERMKKTGPERKNANRLAADNRGFADTSETAI